MTAPEPPAGSEIDRRRDAEVDCDDCGHARADHPDGQACRALLIPKWAGDGECWCGRYVEPTEAPDA